MARLPWFGRHRLRLGTRLALGLGALALGVFAVVGMVMVTNMEGYLADKLDEQMKATQVDLEKDVNKYGKLNTSIYGWFAAVYQVDGDEVTLRPPAGLPLDSTEMREVAREVTGDKPVFRTADLRGEGTYRLRGCPMGDGLVLVSAAPMNDLTNTVRQLVMVVVATFLLALIAFVVIGRAVLRRGLQPLSDMAQTAHDISSHDLTDSARLAVRAEGGSGGVEVEELRTAFNTMLEHIDSSLAARTAAEQRLRRFIADASHELRTPLTSIRGYADLFRYAAANAPQEREAHLERLRSEAARMSVLLDDLLLLARLDSAETEAPLRPVDGDLAELVREAADAFQAARPDHPLTVLPGPEPVRLRFDPMRVRQVLDNLLANAALHTPPGTSVSLSVAVEGRHAVLRVSDTGPGIPAADQARIFDRFYRVDNSRTRDRGGSGLGLAVAHSLIVAHGGTIGLDSRPGSTTFTIRIPRN
ncbi:HAMP domain-containing sensor histidine kinase [Actinosynnema sp. NPDC047251]|uniref:histidine kinase n=1 Tax=Saccharothrix espanaensis (strain ATCC 51144 / DSM 44229 / JCM 9112 / NBRC 15066 / NRRL 15764) TaxID=1179773 RepID=K0JR55_SACES|nr:HAMP domain-containing sensor histidine kinase [Saccharothrix espanaensis]CCH27747.1 putative histidine kinase [Saccharothrix espanaensis DSM 44229]